MFVAVGLSSLLRHHLQILLDVEVSSVVRIGPLTVVRVQRSTPQAGRQKKLRHPKRPTEDIVKTTKDLQERTQLIKWDDSET